VRIDFNRESKVARHRRERLGVRRAGAVTVQRDPGRAARIQRDGKILHADREAPGDLEQRGAFGRDLDIAPREIDLDHALRRARVRLRAARANRVIRAHHRGDLKRQHPSHSAAREEELREGRGVLLQEIEAGAGQVERGGVLDSRLVFKAVREGRDPRAA
jgi:hypothetical protein